MKDATHNRWADGTTYRKGDDWAERIATGVADYLGLPAARTELAVRQMDGANRLVEPIWLVPEHRMSRPAREFAERVLRRNRERLLRI